MGMNEEQVGQTAQMFFNLMNMIATQIAAPAPSQPTPAVPAQQHQPPHLGQVGVEVEDHGAGEESKVKPMDDEDAEWTDGSTDVEASELKAANDNLPPTKIKKKTKRGGGKGSQGKGSASDSSKPSVATKLTKKA